MSTGVNSDRTDPTQGVNVKKLLNLSFGGGPHLIVKAFEICCFPQTPNLTF